MTTYWLDWLVRDPSGRDALSAASQLNGAFTHAISQLASYLRQVSYP